MGKTECVEFLQTSNGLLKNNVNFLKHSRITQSEMMISSMSWTLMRSLRPLAKDKGVTNCKALTLAATRRSSSSSIDGGGDEGILNYGKHIPPPVPPVYVNRPGEEPWHLKRSQPGSGNKRYMWPNYNERIHPPQELKEGEDPEPAYVVHMRPMIKYSPWKMEYIAQLIRGMTVDEAIKQMSFIKLWVAESFCSKAGKVSGIR